MARHCSSHGCPDSFVWLCRGDFWELNRNSGAGVFIALDAQGAAMQFRQPAHDRQSQSNSLLLVQPSIKLHISSHLADVLRGQTAATIGHGKGYEVPGI